MLIFQKQIVAALLDSSQGSICDIFSNNTWSRSQESYCLDNCTDVLVSKNCTDNYKLMTNHFKDVHVCIFGLQEQFSLWTIIIGTWSHCQHLGHDLHVAFFQGTGRIYTHQPPPSWSLSRTWSRLIHMLHFPNLWAQFIPPTHLPPCR